VVPASVAAARSASNANALPLRLSVVNAGAVSAYSSGAKGNVKPVATMLHLVAQNVAQGIERPGLPQNFGDGRSVAALFLLHQHWTGVDEFSSTKVCNLYSPIIPVILASSVRLIGPSFSARECSRTDVRIAVWAISRLHPCVAG